MLDLKRSDSAGDVQFLSLAVLLSWQMIAELMKHQAAGELRACSTDSPLWVRFSQRVHENSK